MMGQQHPNNFRCKNNVGNDGEKSQEYEPEKLAKQK